LVGVSNLTNDRGVFAGAINNNRIDYITITSLGNATDFGDLTDKGMPAGTSSGTGDRGVFGGGDRAGSATSNIIDYITISSAGDAADFGDLTVGRFGVAGTSNA